MIDLPLEFRQILAELELVSAGTTQSWNPSARGGEGSVMPPGEAHPPHLHWRQQYLDATTDERRHEVVNDARDELEQLRRRPAPPPPPETPAEEEARVVAESVGWSAEDVARKLRCTPSRVRRLRAIADRDPDTGKLLNADPVDAPLDERMRELHGGGMSVRAIALLLGVPRSTVHDTLKRAA